MFSWIPLDQRSALIDASDQRNRCVLLVLYAVGDSRGDPEFRRTPTMDATHSKIAIAISQSVINGERGDHSTQAGTRC